MSKYVWLVAVVSAWIYFAAFAEKITSKRSIDFSSNTDDDLPSLTDTSPTSGIRSTWNFYLNPSHSTQSPMEIANILAVANQASNNVFIAQQQMQVAKDDFFTQQRMAQDKENAATAIVQKSDAAVAMQRSESVAAIEAVLLAQQHLASIKAALAHQQRIAAAREAEAADLLHRYAHAAAVGIQDQENDAMKFEQLTRKHIASIDHHLSMTKDNALKDSQSLALNDQIPSSSTASRKSK